MCDVVLTTDSVRCRMSLRQQSSRHYDDSDVLHATESASLLFVNTTGARKSPFQTLSPSPRASPSMFSSRTTKGRMMQGIVLLLAVNLTWVGASELLKHVYESHFDAPVFITYLSNSLFIIMFPVQSLVDRIAKMRCVTAPRSKCSCFIPSPEVEGAFTMKQTAKVALIICPMWFLAQGSYNWSLAATSVASSTILASTSALFTLGFSILLLGERLTWLKSLGVMFSIGGAVCVGLADHDNSENHLWGDALALLSAFMYGLYSTYIRKLVPETLVKMTHFFGFLGTFNMLLLSPLVLGLYLGGVEQLGRLSWEIFGLLLIKGLVDNVLSDWMWARAIVLTSPTIATVALSLTIPLSMIADWWLHGDTPSPALIAGSVLVTAGFISVNAGSEENAPPPQTPKEDPGDDEQLLDANPPFASHQQLQLPVALLTEEP